MSSEVVALPEAESGAVAAERVDVVAGVTAADFLLPAEAFVERCIAAYPGADQLFTLSERGALVAAVRGGRPRIEIVDAVRDRADPETLEATRPRINGLSQGWDKFVVTELLEHYAPDDDVAFVRQVYSQVFDRAPTPVEALEAKFDLKSGRLTRTDLIGRLGARAPSARLSTDLAVAGAGALFNEGKPQIVLLRPAGPDGWIVAPELWVQPAPIENGAFQFQEGWILTGPKRSFPAGWWRLNIDLVQADGAGLVLDVVANSGLDRLLAINLVGSAQFGARFKLDPWHHFVEIRLRRTAQPAERNWLKIRDLSLSVSE